MNKQLKITRISVLNERGEFLNEHLSTLIIPWRMKTAKIAMNILRYIAASVLIPQKTSNVILF